MLVNNMNDQQLEQYVISVIKKFGKTSSFTARQLIDTPTDILSIVNKKFVTLNGALASRPVSSVAVVGQPYYATDTGIPMTFSIQGWRNGVGSVVAGHL